MHAIHVNVTFSRHAEKAGSRMSERGWRYISYSPGTCELSRYSRVAPSVFVDDCFKMPNFVRFFLLLFDQIISFMSFKTCLM